MSRIVHNIDRVLVREQIEKKCALYETRRSTALDETQRSLERYAIDPHLFSGKPELEYINPMYDKWIAHEQNHYSTVRVVRLSKAKYILVYGNANNKTVAEGTGPFKTLKRAKEWFLNGGR